MLRTPRGVFALRPCTRVLMESNLECSSSTETSTDTKRGEQNREESEAE